MKDAIVSVVGLLIVLAGANVVPTALVLGLVIVLVGGAMVAYAGRV